MTESNLQTLNAFCIGVPHFNIGVYQSAKLFPKSRLFLMIKISAVNICKCFDLSDINCCSREAPPPFTPFHTSHVLAVLVVLMLHLFSNVNVQNSMKILKIALFD